MDGSRGGECFDNVAFVVTCGGLVFAHAAVSVTSGDDAATHESDHVLDSTHA